MSVNEKLEPLAHCVNTNFDAIIQSTPTHVRTATISATDVTSFCHITISPFYSFYGIVVILILDQLKSNKL